MCNSLNLYKLNPSDFNSVEDRLSLELKLNLVELFLIVITSKDRGPIIVVLIFTYFICLTCFCIINRVGG